jgi:hypothetical protein
MSIHDDDSKKLSRVRQLFVIVDALIILYVVLDAIAQVLPPHYSPISQAESLLAVGPYGYIMTVNFLNRGVFSLLFVYALVQIFTMLGENWRSYKFGLYAIGIWGVGALMLAGFPLLDVHLAFIQLSRSSCLLLLHWENYRSP